MRMWAPLIAILPMLALDATAAVRIHETRQSLKNTPSTFARAAGAPVSEFARVDKSSTFAPRTVSHSVFRASEVAPERLERTRSLLSEFKAREDRGAILIDMPADILFDFDKATLRPEAEAQLGKAAEVLKSYPNAPVVIEGHTDAKGSDDYNQNLSERRAASVTMALRSRVSQKLTTVGRGETSPVAPNTHPDGSDNPEGRRKNRRVTLIIKPLKM